MRFSWLMAVVLLLATLFAGCGGGQTLRPPEGKPFISGTITQIVKDRILIEEVPDKQEGNKCWLALSEKTKLLRAVGGGYQAGMNVIVGQKVDAWVSGPVLESYPCQGGADTVVIK